ncbi:MAG: radical SAM protein [Bacillota bacterium]|nr:radical SAM protein [Bacillota bacterium]
MKQEKQQKTQQGVSGNCVGDAPLQLRFPQPMTRQQWDNIFVQAADLGISFILLAGGEPLMRKDVLQAAAARKQILFPVFTNGTLMDEDMLAFFEAHRNLIPILSLEGREEATDGRRGAGVYGKLQKVMTELQKREILYGASITVHRENMAEVMSPEFTNELESAGCRAIIYVEYVPIGGSDSSAQITAKRADQQDAEAVKQQEDIGFSIAEEGVTTQDTNGPANDANLALTAEDRQTMMSTLNRLRSDQQEMLFVAFPGDEMASGGCLAAGRGFFHINPYGDAEPCPFSPYSGGSLKEISLKDALHAPLFAKLKESGILEEDHAGGCVLFGREDQVRRMAGGM